jgi:ATP-dependent RNA helicase MSS116, mitochondrial
MESFDDFVPAIIPELTSYVAQWKPTAIQQRTWLPIVAGRDVIGRSETGSGKTLSYALPLVQRVLTDKVKVLIIAPTRELARQVYETVKSILSAASWDGEDVAQCGLEIGGFGAVTAWERPDILVATPGRLAGKKSEELKGYSVVVLDEFDRLLDMGFVETVQDVLKMMPKHRQTILVSATLPESSVSRYLKRDHTVVDCLGTEKTPAVGSLSQSYAVLQVENFVTGVVRAILHSMKATHYKIIVFFPTKSSAAFFSELFNTGLGRRVLELHSGVGYRRTTVAATFEQARSKSVLFTSDVSARGMDYPGVTTVIQVGLARDRETHMHRIGRTARAGMSGEAILLLFEDELDFLSTSLGDMNIQRNAKIQMLVDQDSGNTAIDEDLLQAQQAVGEGSAQRLKEHAITAYRAFLGFYVQHFCVLGVPSSKAGTFCRCRTFATTAQHCSAVALVNNFARQTGLTHLPTVPRSLVHQYTSKDMESLNVERDWGVSSFDVGFLRQS